MQASALQTAPQIDGRIVDDPAWEGAIPASGFWQVRPDEGQAATQKTEVFIGFLEDSLYIGMVARRVVGHVDHADDAIAEGLHQRLLDALAQRSAQTSLLRNATSGWR